MGIYAAMVATVFGITGFFEAATGLGLIKEIGGIPADPFGGLSLIVVASVYLKGIPPLLSSKIGGISYLFVGALMIFAISGLYISMLSATWFGENINPLFEPLSEKQDQGEALGQKVGESRTPLDDFRVEMLFFLLALPGYIVSKNIVGFGKCSEKCLN